MSSDRPEENSRPDLALSAEACAKCGACTAVCPLYQTTGRESLTARGRLHLLAKAARGGVPDPELTEIFAKCLLCGACRAVCPRGIDIPALITQARATMPEVTGFSSFTKFLARQALAAPHLLAAVGAVARPLGLGLDLPATSGLRLTLAAAPPLALADGNFTTKLAPNSDTRPPVGQALYFSGCLAKHLAPTIGLAAEALLSRVCGYDLLVPEAQTCCGLAAKSAGDATQARELARRTIALFSTPAVRSLPVFTTCASCYAGLKGYPTLFADDPEWRHQALAFSDRVHEFSSFILAHQLPTGPGFRPVPEALAVVYHDPCHLRFAGGNGQHQPGSAITAQPRQLLRQVPGIELRELPHGPRCCGQGGLFHLAHPDLAATIRQALVTDFLAAGADLALTSCSGCLVQWQQGLTAAKSTARATHLALFLAGQLA